MFLNTYLKRMVPYTAIFLFVETSIRISLAIRAAQEIDFTLFDYFKIMAIGFWFDLVTLSFLLLPIALYNLLLPQRWQGSVADKIAGVTYRFLFSYSLLFGAVAEHLFWSEFTTRFNFIAVDYLIYTQEVISNIVESYPLPWLLTGIGAGAALITWISLICYPIARELTPLLRKRLAYFACVLVACGLFYALSNLQQTQFKNNTVAGELAGNGTYNLMYSFWHNEIDYERFYASQPNEKVLANARALLKQKNQTYVHNQGNDLTRLVTSIGVEQHKNVILVVMESMSGEYMQSFGNTQGITPNLDRLGNEGLFLTNLYATGTRTVRGLEATTLSIPPTPGQSIVRRPNNANLFSLGFIFKDRGYDTKFIYGGYGYFDNMNAFYAGNGFDILDHKDMPKDQINFMNAWGVCDEDMFTRAIKEADADYAKKKPFMYSIMTTSNHRPFTYPEGKIDIPQKQKIGAVKYADYSVGRLIEEAKTKPWFKDTVFVFVSDHTAGAGGKAELNPAKYHIPMIFYAPGFIKPQKVDKLTSQIDMAPTLLGLLNFTYYTKFYGEDVLHDTGSVPHAYISNYQKVSLIKDNQLTVLAPKRKITQFDWPEVGAERKTDQPGIDDAIAYYQSASWWKENYRRIPTVVGK